MNYITLENEERGLDEKEVRDALFALLDQISPARKVMVIPPDMTRFHSYAGMITGILNERLGDQLSDVLPALGTHHPMSGKEIMRMYPGVDPGKFRVHRWRDHLVTLGEVPGSFVHEVSEGRVDYPWPAQVNKLLLDDYDLIVSVGQVVPHEVSGMANHNKNIFVGTGGQEGINKSHFLGAVYGLERMMGRVETPVRKVLDYASGHFARDLPILYILTVTGRNEEGEMKLNGLYAGTDGICLRNASKLSLKVNFTLLDNALEKIVVYLDPDEFRSTWLGNKSIYRTRMAIADGGSLIVLAPGLESFGEDREIDRLIRKYGYRTTEEILDATDRNKDLQDNLSAAAHLIHGSSENRFRVVYATSGLSREEVLSVGYDHAPVDDMMSLYDPGSLKDGWNRTRSGEEFYYISNPALGLWSTRERFR